MKIAITGGKGGTGKSTIATALAVELSKNYKVILIDADVECPNDHLILSIERKRERDVFQPFPIFNFEKCIKCGTCASVCRASAIVFVKDKYPILINEQCMGCSACMISCPKKAINEGKKKIGTIYSGFSRIKLISGEMEVGNEESSPVVNALKKFAAKFENEFEFIIIDTGAGTHCNVISALLGCDLALAVTEPTPLGAHDLKLILELLKILKIPSKVVLNKSTIGNKNLIKEVVQKFGAEIIAEVPYKKSILKAFSDGTPIKEKNIKKLCEKICKE